MSFENTENYKLFEKYQIIKHSLAIKYKEIDISKVLASDLLGIVMFPSNPKFINYIFLPFLRIDASKFVAAFQNYDTVFSTIYNDRKDHKELLEKIVESTDNSCQINVTPHKKNFIISATAIFWSFKYIFNNVFLKDITFNKKMYLVLRTIYFCHQIETFFSAFSQIDLKEKKYIPFISGVGVEAAFTSFFNYKGVQTFHIFHGLFGRYRIRIPNDIINGENILAKKILAFGTIQSHDLIQDFGCSPVKIEIAGNPKYPFKKIDVSLNFKNCIVLGGFSFYDKEFLLLLKLLNSISLETAISFHVKPHPNSKILSLPEIKDLKNVNFIEKGITLNELFSGNNYDFAITFNTVTYYECMYYNLVCLRYEVNENLDFEGLDDRFVDKKTFLERIEKFKATNKQQLNLKITSLLESTLGMGINNYNTLIK